MVPKLRSAAGEQPLQVGVPPLWLLHELRRLLLGVPARGLDFREIRGSAVFCFRDKKGLRRAHFIDISLTIAVPYVRRSHTPVIVTLHDFA